MESQQTLAQSFQCSRTENKRFFIEFWNAVLRWSSSCSPPTTEQPTTCHPLTVSLPSTHRPTFQYRLYRCVCVRLVKKPRLSRCICCKVEQHQPEEYLSQVRLGLKQSQHVLAGDMHFEKILFHVPSSFFLKVHMMYFFWRVGHVLRTYWVWCSAKSLIERFRGDIYIIYYSWEWIHLSKIHTITSQS